MRDSDASPDTYTRQFFDTGQERQGTLSPGVPSRDLAAGIDAHTRRTARSRAAVMPA